MNWTELLEAATRARARAYCPYSRFPVGAAILTADGTVFEGCNIENRSYGLTVCGERTAVLAAVAAGHREVIAVAVVTDTDPPSAPCGQCREVLSEFGSPDLPVVLSNLDGDRVEYQLRDLLPHPFELPAAD